MIIKSTIHKIEVEVTMNISNAEAEKLMWLCNVHAKHIAEWIKTEIIKCPELFPKRLNSCPHPPLKTLMHKNIFERRGLLEFV